MILGINIENVSEGLGPSVDRPGTWNSANQFKNLCTEKMNFKNVGFRRNAKEMEVRKDFARLRSMVDDSIGTVFDLRNLINVQLFIEKTQTKDMVLIFISTHASGFCTKKMLQRRFPFTELTTCDIISL